MTDRSDVVGWADEPGASSSTGALRLWPRKAHRGAPRRTKAYQGVPRRTKANQGVPRRTKAYQGVPRRTKANQGEPRRTRAHPIDIPARQISRFVIPANAGIQLSRLILIVLLALSPSLTPSITAGRSGKAPLLEHRARAGMPEVEQRRRGCRMYEFGAGR
jgi:hypothetical protein